MDLLSDLEATGGSETACDASQSHTGSLRRLPNSDTTNLPVALHPHGGNSEGRKQTLHPHHAILGVHQEDAGLFLEAWNADRQHVLPATPRRRPGRKRVPFWVVVSGLRLRRPSVRRPAVATGGSKVEVVGEAFVG